MVRMQFRILCSPTGQHKGVWEPPSAGSADPLAGAGGREAASGAPGLARDADLPAVPAEPRRELPPLPPRDRLRQVLLDLPGVLRPRQAEPEGDPCDVGVHGEGGNPEARPEKDRGGLPSHAGQRGKFLHRFRHAPAVAGDDRGGKSPDRLRLVPEEAGGAHGLLHLLLRSLRERGGPGVRAEQPGRHAVHPLVGALSGEDGGDQQFEGVPVFQQYPRAGVRAAQEGEDLLHGGGHGLPAPHSGSRRYTITSNPCTSTSKRNPSTRNEYRFPGPSASSSANAPCASSQSSIARTSRKVMSVLVMML